MPLQVANPDADGDSQMATATSTSPSSSNPTTPPTQQQNLPTSPPDSQHRPGAGGMANANGKRPLHTINGDDELQATHTNSASAAAGTRPREKVHAASGYRWSRTEDEPGYSWLNKKAVDEFHRHADALVHRQFVVAGRWGDPFEMVDKEKAIAASLKQQ